MNFASTSDQQPVASQNFVAELFLESRVSSGDLTTQEYRLEGLQNGILDTQAEISK